MRLDRTKETLEERRRGMMHDLVDHFKEETIVSVVSFYWPSSSYTASETGLTFFRSHGYSRLYELALCTKISTLERLEKMLPEELSKDSDAARQIDALKDSATVLIIPPPENTQQIRSHGVRRLSYLLSETMSANPHLRIGAIFKADNSLLSGSILAIQGDEIVRLFDKPEFYLHKLGLQGCGDSPYVSLGSK